MNGAESLVRTLVAGGVNVCFTNPGTSEMHFVAALDKVDGMRCVLGLFEGVVTGAADGYWRMAERAGGDAAAPGAGTRQRSRQPPQRQEGQLGDRQHRRRPRDVSHQARRAADCRHRGDRAAGLGWVRTSPNATHGRRRRRGRHRRRAHAARPDRHPHPAGRHGVERGRRRRGRPAGAGAHGVDREAVGALREGAALGRAGLLMLTGRAVRDGPGAGRPHRHHDRRAHLAQGSNARIAARRRPRADRAPPLSGRPGAGGAEGRPPSDPRRREGAGGVLRLSRQAQPAHAGGLRDSQLGPAEDSIAASRRWPTRSARRRTARSSTAQPARAAHGA